MIICFFDRFSPGAKCFTSSSRDGSIKLWDGVSNKCVNTFQKAHGGAEVCSVLFSRNGKVGSNSSFYKQFKDRLGD